MIEAGPIERSIHLMFEVARDYACLARKHDKQPAGELDSLAAFVQTASQQMPADMRKIKSGSVPPMTRSSAYRKLVKATMSSTADLAPPSQS